MDAMETAYLLAAYKGADLSKNRTDASVMALVGKGWLTEDLQLTERGIAFARFIEGVAKDAERLVART